MVYVQFNFINFWTQTAFRKNILNIYFPLWWQQESMAWYWGINLQGALVMYGAQIEEFHTTYTMNVLNIMG